MNNLKLILSNAGHAIVQFELDPNQAAKLLDVIGGYEDRTETNEFLHPLFLSIPNRDQKVMDAFNYYLNHSTGRYIGENRR